MSAYQHQLLGAQQLIDAHIEHLEGEAREEDTEATGLEERAARSRARAATVREKISELRSTVITTKTESL